MAKVIIFDVDGTLLDTERVYMDAWRQAGPLFGYEISDNVLLKTRAVDRSVAVAVFETEYGSEFPYDAIFKERVRISEEIIAAATADELIKPGAEHVLVQLKNAGWILAVASSTDIHKTRSHLAQAGLLRFFLRLSVGIWNRRKSLLPMYFCWRQSILVFRLVRASLLEILLPMCLPQRQQAWMYI